METANRYYRHSGDLSLFGMNLGGALGVIAAAVLGIAYGYVIHYSPFVYLNALFVLIYGGAVGFIAGTAAKWGKVRSFRILVLMGLTVGIVAVYTGWVAYIYAVSRPQVLLLSPDDLIGAARDIAQQGLWSVFGHTPTGATLWIIWIIEAVMIVGSCTLMAITPVGNTPFCESCNRWTIAERDFVKLEVVNEEAALKEALEAGDQQPLLEMQKEAIAQNGRTEIRVDICPGCRELVCLTLDAVSFKTDEKGEQQKTERNLISQLLLSSGDYSVLRDRFGYQGQAE